MLFVIIDLSGWWFGCHFLFSHILGIIIPIDFHIFQRGSNHQPVCSVEELAFTFGRWKPVYVAYDSTCYTYFLYHAPPGPPLSIVLAELLAVKKEVLRYI